MFVEDICKCLYHTSGAGSRGTGDEGPSLSEASLSTTELYSVVWRSEAAGVRSLQIYIYIYISVVGYH